MDTYDGGHAQRAQVHLHLKKVCNVPHSMTSKYLPTDKSTQAAGKNNSRTPKTLGKQILAKISANIRTNKQYNPLGTAVGSETYSNDLIKKKFVDAIHRRCGLEIVIAPLHTIL